MAAWHRVLLLTGLVLALAAPVAHAAEDGQPIQPEVSRKKIDPAAIDSEDFEVSAYYGLLSIEDFGSAPVYGLKAAYHITEGLFVEGVYGRSKAGETSYERLSGAAQLLTASQRTFTYYNLSLGYNLLPGEVFIGKNWAFNSALYVIGGVGTTTFADDDAFTINYGAGYRLLLTDWLAFHLDARDHMFTLDLLGERKRTHNLELSTGFSVFF